MRHALCAMREFVKCALRGPVSLLNLISLRYALCAKRFARIYEVRYARIYEVRFARFRESFEFNFSALCAMRHALCEVLS